jgi:hypothetical protein
MPEKAEGGKKGMSHFTVAVFSKEGQTIESLLAPFDENITVERYVKYTKEQLIKKSKKGNT